MSVEGELGCLGSLESGMGEKEDGHGAEGVLSHDQLLTDPNEAADFVKATQVDALAIAIGTSHGAYKFTRPPTGDVLRIDRIKEIHARIPNTHLVMHGSSSVPQDWLTIINEYGGDMGETYGVPVEEIVEGIKNGVRKVNIDTDLRMASTGAIRQFLNKDRKNFDPRKYLAEATKAMKGICKARYEAFGCAGQASKIKVDQPREHGQPLQEGRAERRRQVRRFPPIGKRPSGKSRRPFLCRQITRAPPSRRAPPVARNDALGYAAAMTPTRTSRQVLFDTPANSSADRHRYVIGFAAWASLLDCRIACLLVDSSSRLR